MRSASERYSRVTKRQRTDDGGGPSDIELVEKPVYVSLYSYFIEISQILKFFIFELLGNNYCVA